MSDNEQGNENRETVADIVAEMRYRGKCPNPIAVMRLGELAQYTDRIDAAWKREREAVEADALAVGGVVEAARHRPGNFATMREELENAYSLLCEGIATEVDDELEYPFHLELARKVIKSALSAPARNCDKFADETDAQIAFLNEVWLISVTKETALERDRFENWTDEMKSRYAKWLFAPAEERKGERDGK